MALEAAFRELQIHLRILAEMLTELHTTIVEDKPVQDDVVLVDIFGDTVEDLLGWTEEALNDAIRGEQAVIPTLQLDEARRALTACHERFYQIQHHYASDLTCYERIAELHRFGRERKGAWQRWTSDVKAALDRCQTPLYNLDHTLLHCWHEITERAGLLSVSVQTTSIGQQITGPSNRQKRRAVAK